ncbi:MAG: hypothetical protein V3V08_21985 [Nannocystaceae bacterium]
MLRTHVSPVVDALTPLSRADVASFALDLTEVQRDLDRLAEEALSAQSEGVSFATAVHDPRFPALREFHQGLRDALLVEVPRELEDWVQRLSADDTAAQEDVSGFYSRLFEHAYRPEGPAARGDTLSPISRSAALQSALSHLLLFEAVRLRLLVASWSSEEFESLGGEDTDVDAIACTETDALLCEPGLDDPRVRPMSVIVASASVALARDAAQRADVLRNAGEEEREQLRMRARLRSALRELRLPESVLLENALANLMGDRRVELTDLQADRPLALAGMSRQAMDQRISRGRRALAKPRRFWPSRRKPALFDLARN